MFSLRRFIAFIFAPSLLHVSLLRHLIGCIFAPSLLYVSLLRHLIGCIFAPSLLYVSLLRHLIACIFATSLLYYLRSVTIVFSLRFYRFYAPSIFFLRIFAPSPHRLYLRSVANLRMSSLRRYRILALSLHHLYLLSVAIISSLRRLIVCIFAPSLLYVSSLRCYCIFAPLCFCHDATKQRCY